MSLKITPRTDKQHFTIGGVMMTQYAWDITRLYALGMSAKEIAKILKVSKSCVGTQVHRSLKAIGIERNPVWALTWMLRHGQITVAELYARYALKEVA